MFHLIILADNKGNIVERWPIQAGRLKLIRELTNMIAWIENLDFDPCECGHDRFYHVDGKCEVHNCECKSWRSAEKFAGYGDGINQDSR